MAKAAPGRAPFGARGSKLACYRPSYPDIANVQNNREMASADDVKQEAIEVEGLSRRLLNLAECGGRSSSRLYSCSPSVTIEFAVTGGYADSGPLTIVDREPILAVAR